MGRRVHIVTKWLTQLDVPTNPDVQGLPAFAALLEKTVAALFPFLTHTGRSTEGTPLTSLRKSFIPGSKGIVIPTGKKTFRYTCHLIYNLRSVLKSTLPIQIVYASDSDLPLEQRTILLSLDTNIELLDVTKVLDDSTLQLSHGNWAIKPFALLASKFEQVILIDSDAVFFQQPEVIFSSHSGYRKTGTLFFHDRLVGRGKYESRHQFWRQQMRHRVPSATFKKSRVMNEGWGQEAESGVVVIDKGRLPVLMGLLHACWQNTWQVRDKVTYRQTHGDKETYWMGMELSGVGYTFAEFYGGALGHAVRNATTGRTEVCGSTIAHVDERKELLWLNGGLVRRKDGKEGERVFVDEGFKYWVLGGTGRWRWTEVGWDMACMEGGKVREVGGRELDVLGKTVEGAKGADERWGVVMGLVKEKEKVGVHKDGVASGVKGGESWDI
ncbi:hypothetical protein CJF30_00005000 [Rutstroemia sp. NJR-2017a BBW]|nr:hypothetical protein CJF30_00005000 [Rutstroemia sp. NJR-2017a BBW]